MDRSYRISQSQTGMMGKRTLDLPHRKRVNIATVPLFKSLLMLQKLLTKTPLTYIGHKLLNLTPKCRSGRVQLLVVKCDRNGPNIQINNSVKQMLKFLYY